MRAACSRWCCTRRSSAWRCRVASASVSSSMAPKANASPATGVAASNSTWWVRNAGIAGPDCDEAARQREPGRVARLPQRGCPHQQRAEQRESCRLDERRQAGRSSSVPSYRFSINCAWISLPGMRFAHRRGVVVARPTPVTAISTSFCVSCARSARPCNTSTADTNRPDGAARSTRGRTRRPRWRRNALPIAMPRIAEPEARRRSEGSPAATRNISTPAHRSACR